MKYEDIVKYITQRLSLRKPQKKSLEILDEVLDTVKLGKEEDAAAQLQQVTELGGQWNPPITFKGFDRDFMSLCFALATGVGKTRLMGAFITYLHKAYGYSNFIVIAPNLTIYNKLVTDFTPGTPKYVFTGIDVFHQNTPVIITGDNYQSGAGIMENSLLKSVVINIFNISKLTAKDKGHLAAGDSKGKIAKIRRLSESIGESYFDYLASRKDLVVIMDESHRYRAEAGAAAINELKPILGIELTATPRIVQGQQEIPFNNIIFEYNLAAAMKDGFVKEPAIATRQGFDTDNYTKDSDELEHLKLNDGIFLHEQTKLALENYAFNHNVPEIKPFMLVVAEDKAHADHLEEYLASPAFRGGAYADKIIKVYSGMGADEEKEMIEKLLEIEKKDNPAEIVIHVNKLSEGWDVTNLYTIVPLRAANSPNLVEQSIGRGLRLPYGKRTGDEAVDTLTVVSHDHYAEIIQAAKDGKLAMMKSYIIGEDCTVKGKKSVILTPVADIKFAPVAPAVPVATSQASENSGSEAKNTQQGDAVPPVSSESTENVSASSTTTAVQNIAAEIKQLADDGVAQGKVEPVDQVAEQVKQAHSAEGTAAGNDIGHIVHEAVAQVQSLTIEIPRIFLHPKQAVFCRYDDFDLDTTLLPSYVVDDNMLKVTSIQSHRTRKFEDQQKYSNLQLAQQMLLSKLVNFDDIDYDGNAQLIQKQLAATSEYLCQKYGEVAACNILCNYCGEIAQQIHQQILAHAVYEDVEYDVEVKNGYFKLSQVSVLIDQQEDVRDFEKSLGTGEKQKIKSMIFGGFKKCLYQYQKFDSDPERGFACVLEAASEVKKWFRPALSNFSISWRGGNYQPDFIVEADDAKYICEVKSDKEVNDADVKEKMRAALVWCTRATEQGSTPWRYIFIPHSKIDCGLDFSTAKSKFAKKLE